MGFYKSAQALAEKNQQSPPCLIGGLNPRCLLAGGYTYSAALETISYHRLLKGQPELAVDTPWWGRAAAEIKVPSAQILNLE